MAGAGKRLAIHAQIVWGRPYGDRSQANPNRSRGESEPFAMSLRVLPTARPQHHPRQGSLYSLFPPLPCFCLSLPLVFRFTRDKTKKNAQKTSKRRRAFVHRSARNSSSLRLTSSGWSLVTQWEAWSIPWADDPSRSWTLSAHREAWNVCKRERKTVRNTHTGGRGGY